MSVDFAGLFRELYACIASERLAWEGRGAESVRGKTTIAQALEPLLR